MPSCSCCHAHWLLHWVGKQCLSPIKHHSQEEKFKQKLFPIFSRPNLVGVFLGFSLVLQDYVMLQTACFSSCSRDSEPAGHFQPDLRSRVELQGGTMALQRRWWQTHTSQESQREEGKESNSLSSCIVEELQLDHVFLNNRATSWGNNFGWRAYQGMHTHCSCSLIQLKVNQARDRHPLESRHC